MVSDLNQIIENNDFSSEEDTRDLVFICANNPNFELPFGLLTRYPVLQMYAEYWEKGHEILAKNAQLLTALERTSVMSMEEQTREAVNRTARLSYQRKAIRKYLRNHPEGKIR